MIFSRVKQATDEFIKVLRFGKDDVQTPLPVLPHGLDSKPVKEDLAVTANTTGDGENVVLGYVKLFSETQEGETRLYATDQEGALVFDLLFNNAGELIFNSGEDNAVRYSKLEDAYNELKGKFNDLVSAFNQHVHASSGAPPTPVPSVIPAQPSTGDISPAKIDEIKMP
jgi:hypothetical protein